MGQKKKSSPFFSNVLLKNVWIRYFLHILSSQVLAFSVGLTIISTSKLYWKSKKMSTSFSICQFLKCKTIFKTIHIKKNRQIDLPCGHQLTRMVGVIGDSELTIITLLGLARDVKTFTEVEKDLGISVCTLDKSKTFLGIVNCSLFTSLIRNLE